MTADPPDLRVALRSDPRLLRTVRSMVRCYLDDLGWPADEAELMVLAVDEACTNAIRHACHGVTDATYELILHGGESELVFEVIDPGEPADLEGIASRCREVVDADTVRPGGLGLDLMRKTFDEVEFGRGPEGGNRVVLTRRRPQRGTT